MKRKLLSIILGAAMCTSLLAGCGSGADTAANVASSVEEAASTAVSEAAETASSVEEEVKETVESAALPTDYKYYFSMDGGESGVHVATQDTAATPIVQIDDSKEVTYIPGVKGQAAYTNGTNGFKLDVDGVGETYSVSYWMYASRSAQYMPTLQYGPDMHGDATGGQHYVNFTWASWNPASDDLSWPSVWSYDQNADGSPWPNWYADEVNDYTRQWVNLTMTVDPADTDAATGLIAAHLYVNGEELVGKDSDGNNRPVYVTQNTMASSDNYDFLLGVNYWDAIFKGAFDEVYVFDRVLSAGEAKALYEAGDATASFEEPERVIEVVADDSAIDHVGTTDLSLGFWTDWSKATELKDGETKEVKLRNFSDGVANWDNYLLLFTNEETPAHEDPNTAGSADHKEWAVLRADAYGWMGDKNPDTDADLFTFEWNWGNWATWLQQCMMDTTATLKISRDGDTITVVANNVDLNGTENICTSTVKTEMTADDPCFFQITGEKCYIDIFSITDAIVITPDASAIETVGKVDLTNGWWTDWSSSYEIKDGEKKTFKFNNYSDGKNNWDNYVLMFTNEETPAHENPNYEDGAGSGSADHVEYAAVRADAFGWDDEYVQAYETSWGDDWATWLAAMMDAEVTLTLERKGGDITIDALIVDRNGEKLTNKTTLTANTLTGADPVYMIITCEECYIEILSVE